MEDGQEGHLPVALNGAMMRINLQKNLTAFIILPEICRNPPLAKLVKTAHWYGVCELRASFHLSLPSAATASCQDSAG